MIIYLSTKDMAHILSAHLFNNGLANEAKLDMDFGIVNGEIVAVAAAGESLPTLQTVADLTAPRTSGAVPDSTDDVEGDDPDYEEGSDGDDSVNTDGSKKQKRKRRTKAEIEQDRLNAEKAAAAASAEEGIGVQTSKADETPAQAEPESEPNEADDAAPFNVDEGANIRAEAEMLPDSKPVSATEEDAATAEAATVKADPVADPNDPFAQVEEVSQEGDELFAQPGEVVTPVTDKTDGFVKPAEADPEDPFANFN